MLTLNLLSFLSFCVFVLGGGVSISTTNDRKTCTVTPLGDGQDDTPNIVEAFTECGANALVVFPEGQNYTIGTRLNPYVVGKPRRVH